MALRPYVIEADRFLTEPKVSFKAKYPDDPGANLTSSPEDNTMRQSISLLAMRCCSIREITSTALVAKREILLFEGRLMFSWYETCQCHSTRWRSNLTTMPLAVVLNPKSSFYGL